MIGVITNLTIKTVYLQLLCEDTEAEGFKQSKPNLVCDSILFLFKFKLKLKLYETCQNFPKLKTEIKG